MKKPNLISYKLLALIPFMMLAGCKKFEHKNVIKEIGEIKNSKAFVLQDVETGVERLYLPYGRDKWYVDYLVVGDTVILGVGSACNTTEQGYHRTKVFSRYDMKATYNSDSIYIRREREKFNKLKQEMYNNQQTR